MAYQIKTPRQYEKRQCSNPACGKTYDAPVKIIGEGLIGGGLCPECLRASLPGRHEKCPVCTKKFYIQAGHQRTTCSRKCRTIYTMQKDAERNLAETERLRLEAAELMQERAAEELADATRAAESARAVSAEADATARETKRAAKRTSPAKQEGNRLERLGRINGKARRTRAASEPVAA